MKPSNSLKIFLILNAFLICILISGSVDGAECNPQALVEDCTISASMTLGGGTYYLNDTNNNGALVVNAHNITIDGNGTILIGNYSGTSRSIFINAKKNITIYNLTMMKYSRGIQIQSSNNTNITLINSTNNVDGIYYTTSLNNWLSNNFFLNNSNAHIRLVTDANNTYINNNYCDDGRYPIRLEIRSGNNIIKDNVLVNSSFSSPVGIYVIQNSTNNTFINNTVSNIRAPVSILSNNIYLINNTFNSNLITSTVLDLYNNNSIIRGNVLIGNQSKLNYVININQAENITIDNNTLKFSQYSIGTSSLSKNIDIINNIIKDGDMGGVLSGIYINYINNTIVNTSANYDSYDMGLKLSHLRNSIINNNTFSEMSSAGIGWLNSSNVTISSNSFSFIPFSLRGNYLANDLYDPPCALKGYESYKSYLGGSLESGGLADISYLSSFKSSDVVLLGNLFDSNTQCYLMDTAESVISNDLLSYWKVSLQAPTYLFDNIDYYISNSFNNLSTYTGGYQDNVFRIRYNGKEKFNISISKNKYHINNINITDSYNVSFSNTVKILAINETNYGVIYNNKDNITIAPNRTIDVLSNFNLTEGTSRQFSPLWFSYSNTTTKHVASNLTNTINATIIFNVESCNAKKIIYKSNSLTYQTTYLPGSFTCANNILQIDNVPIETATSSNEFEIQYVVLPQTQPIQTTFNNVIAKSILGIILISALGFAIRWLVLNITQGEGLVDSVKYLILFIIWITVFLILFFVISGYIMTNWYPST